MDIDRSANSTCRNTHMDCGDIAALMKYYIEEIVPYQMDGRIAILIDNDIFS